MTRAVLRNPSARAEWLLAGLIDRAYSHWVRAPPLDGGDGDDGADTGTDTAIPDDNDDDGIASRQSTIYITAAIKVSHVGQLGLLFDVSGQPGA